MNTFEKALHGLKDTYPSPDPEREKLFLESLQEQSQPIRETRHRTVFYVLPACAAAAVMVITGISLYQKMDPHRLPMIDTIETTTMTVEEATDFQSPTQEMIADPMEPTDDAIAEPEETQLPSASSPAASATDGQGSAAAETTLPLSTQPSSPVQQPVQTKAPSTRPSVTQPAQNNTVTETQPQPQVTTQVVQTPTVQEETDSCGDIMDEPLPDSPIYDPTEYLDDFEPIPCEPIGKNMCVTPLYHYKRGNSTVSYRELTCGSPAIPIETDNDNYDLKALAEQADIIVLAYVENSFYTQANHTAYTQLDIEVQSVIKGKCNTNDKLSVYEKGGYLPLDAAVQLDPSLAEITVDADGIEYPGNGTQVGNMRCFFLKLSSSSDIPSGAYVYAGSDATCCLYQLQTAFRSIDGRVNATYNELLQSAR